MNGIKFNLWLDTITRINEKKLSCNVTITYLNCYSTRAVERKVVIARSFTSFAKAIQAYKSKYVLLR